MQKDEIRKHKAEAEADSCRSALLCCAVLLCAVLLCAEPVLCFALLCCALLCCALLDSRRSERNKKQKQKQTAALLCCAVLCCAVLNFGARESKRFTAQSRSRSRRTQLQRAVGCQCEQDFTHRKENADMSKNMYFKR